MVEILSMISKVSLLLFGISFVLMVYYWFHHNILNVYREIKGKNVKYADRSAQNKPLKLKTLTRNRTIPVITVIDETDDSETELIEEDETIILDETTVLEKAETACVNNEEEQTVLIASSTEYGDEQTFASTDDETVLIASEDETTYLYDNQNETVLMEQQANEDIQMIDEAIMIHTDETIE